ncbi:MAG: efflux RND transporter periplasmic adaptor subunit, partial [Coraliomargarita sp.]
ESVKEGKELFKLADLSSMWLDLSISPEYAALVQRGQVVKVRFDGSNMSSLEAVITWVDSAIDSRNRMLKARAVIENTDGRIRQGMFGYGDITISERGQALLLPQEAVQYHENRPYVFVKEGADLYKLRHVRLGHMLNDQVAIVEGISPEEEVVTAGAFIAMSEFLKSRLGAGCVDD